MNLKTNSTMMKRLLVVLVTMVGAIAANADDYPYLTVEKSDGTCQSVAVEGLTLCFDNGSLVATSGSQSYSFTLTDLKRMYFSTSEVISDIQHLTPDTQQSCAVEVFTPDGVSLGQYDNLKAAQGALSQGLYIFKTNGKTLKVMVR